MKLLTPFVLLFLVFANCNCAFSQSKMLWKNKKCAVALTYDDALNIHLDQVVPALDRHGFKGTFYLIASRPAFTERMPEWKQAADRGHEMGNHTLFHPCIGRRPGREWVTPEYDMGTYTIKRMTDEILITNSLLKSVDGKTKRTLACPCGDARIGDSSYLYSVQKEMVAYRDAVPDAVNLNRFGNATIHWMVPNGETGEDMIARVRNAMNENALLIFVFHGVGGEHNLNVPAEAHEQLLQFLKQHESDIWVAPFIDVAEYMQLQARQAQAGR